MSFTAIQSGLENWPILIPVSIFLLAFIESVALLGMFIPGATILLGIAALAGAMEFGFHWIMLATFLGAWLGDLISYLIGVKLEHRLQHVWPMSAHPTLWTNGHQFFEKHGGMSVFLGRFLGPLRAVVPAIAGVMEMPFRQFQIANVTSAVLWSCLWAAPGYYGGNLIAEQPDAFIHFLSLSAFISAALYGVWLLLRVVLHYKQQWVWPAFAGVCAIFITFTANFVAQHYTVSTIEKSCKAATPDEAWREYQLPVLTDGLKWFAENPVGDVPMLSIGDAIQYELANKKWAATQNGGSAIIEYEVRSIAGWIFYPEVVNINCAN